MGLKSIVISHLPPITFSEPGLRLDARGLKGLGWSQVLLTSSGTHTSRTHMPRKALSEWLQSLCWVKAGPVPSQDCLLLLEMSMALMGDGQDALGGDPGKMCASSVGWPLGTSVQRDSHGVLPVLVTWHAVFNLITVGSWALKVLASKQTLKSYLTCHSLPCNSFT